MKTYDDVVDFHGHSCPGLALGYRVALRALREFKGRSEDEELVAVVENNSCAVDAVQVMTGCTFGKGNLIVNNYGKQVYTFIRRPSGKGIRIVLNWKGPSETEEAKAILERFRKGNRSKTIMRFVHDRKAAKIKYITGADEKEFMAVTRVKEEPPPEAEIYMSIDCSICGEKVAEPMARIRSGKIVCIPCFEKKG